MHSERTLLGDNNAHLEHILRLAQPKISPLAYLVRGNRRSQLARSPAMRAGAVVGQSLPVWRVSLVGYYDIAARDCLIAEHNNAPPPLRAPSP